MCEVLDPQTGRRGRGRAAGRAGRHEPRPDGQPRHPLPHRRHRRPPIRSRALRPDVGAARGRHPGTRRRHGEHPRRQRVSGGIESVVRRFAEVVEFRSTVSRPGAMRSLRLEIEVAPELERQSMQRPSARGVSRLREALGLTVPVHVVEPGTLPRFEMKARRFVVEG